MTMAAGLEARVPLLSAELLDLAERAQDNQKATLRGGKLALRAVARRRLPSYITRGSKRGFAVPLGDLLTGAWRREADEWFASAASDVIDPRRLVELLRLDTLPATDAWAAAVLIQWEQRVAAAAAGAP